MADNRRYSTFFLNNICFGVPIEDVQEFMEHQHITRVPLAPPVLPGIINFRGRILTTIDLRIRLGLTSVLQSENPMMMVIRTSEGSMNLLVDKIGMVLDVDSKLFEKPAETLKPAVRDVTLHVCKQDQQLLLVLDTEKLIHVYRDDPSHDREACAPQGLEHSHQ
jgi:purine-binding chemotaxis protein CheW